MHVLVLNPGHSDTSTYLNQDWQVFLRDLLQLQISLLEVARTLQVSGVSPPLSLCLRDLSKQHPMERRTNDMADLSDRNIIR